MPGAAWVTLIIAALIIAITAVGLLRVIFHLRAISATLRQVTGGIAAVAQLTSTGTHESPAMRVSRSRRALPSFPRSRPRWRRGL